MKQKLFESTKIGSCTLKNRVALGPMGPIYYSAVGGGFNEDLQNFYIRIAQGGTGLIISGICAVNYDELLDFSTPCPSYSPASFVCSTKPMLERIHSYDAKMFLQLTGGLGRSAFPGATKIQWAPSESINRFDPTITHREMTRDEILKLIQDMVKSAAVAQMAGFDGVEIHAVHEGYLLDQFALAFYNYREDEFGGSLENRLRIVTEMVKGIHQICGDSFPVSLRYSLRSFTQSYGRGILPGEEAEEQGRNLKEGLEAARLLVDAGIASLDADAGTYDAWYWNHPPMYFGHKGIYTDLMPELKKAVDVPIILCGRMDDEAAIKQAFNTEAADIIGFARPLLADPDLPAKIKKNAWADIRPCLSCHDGCMGRIANGAPFSCTVNPACGREVRYGLKTAHAVKKVLVIGGGVGGMEAARVAAVRGHRVELKEAASALGGKLIPGSQPSFKGDDRDLLAWYERQLHKLGVDIQLNTPASEMDFQREDVEVIIMATGSALISPPFPVSGHTLESPEALLLRRIKPGRQVVITGAGLVGSELALMLREEYDCEVTLVDMLPFVCGGPQKSPFMNWQMMTELLPFKGVKLLLSTRIEQLAPEGLKVQNALGVQTLRADTFVNAMGYEPYQPFKEAYESCEKECYNIGDSNTTANIMNAIWQAYEVARSI